MPLGYNRVLGSCKVQESARPHRVALGNWPTMIDDPRTKTLEALLGHISTSGYEGLEFGIGSITKFYPGDSASSVAKKFRRDVERFNLRVFGTTLFASDDGMRKNRWMEQQIDDMKVVQDLGGEFANYQIAIAPDYANTGGDYRDDETYLRFCADRVAELRQAAWDLNLNFYTEVHVDRITEDPAGLCRILDMADCELTGDMSHYLSRGYTKGKRVERVLDHLGHTHVRMARMYGDLSAAVADPKADWEQKGVTWQLFQFMKRGFNGGLSSRTITGETGPMHLVKDTLTQDAALVPLYRAMARYADASAQGIVVKVEEPADLKPWG